MKVKKHDNSPINKKLMSSPLIFTLDDNDVKPLTIEQMEQAEKLYFAISTEYSYTCRIFETIHGHILHFPARNKERCSRFTIGEISALAACSFIRWIEIDGGLVQVGI